MRYSRKTGFIENLWKGDSRDPCAVKSKSGIKPPSFRLFIPFLPVTASGTRLVYRCGFLKNKFRKPCLRQKIISKQSLNSLKVGSGNDSTAEMLPSLRKVMREPLKVLSETVEEAQKCPRIIKTDGFLRKIGFFFDFSLIFPEIVVYFWIEHFGA